MKAQSDKGNLAERMLKLEAKVEKVVDRIKESEDLMTANIFESDTQFEEFKMTLRSCGLHRGCSCRLKMTG